MSIGKDNLTKNTILLSACTLLNKGLMFIMVPLFSRWLTVGEYGSFDVLSTYVSLFVPIITLASGNAVFRLTVDETQPEARVRYISNGFFIVAVNLALSVLLITALSMLFGWKYPGTFLLLMAGNVLDNYFQGYLRAIKRLDIYALCRTVSVVFTAVLVTVLVRLCGLGLDGILLGSALGLYISDLFIILLTKYWRFFSLQAFSLGGIRELVSYSYALIPNDLSWWVINVSDRTIISLVLGTAANGIYAIACKLPNLCSSVFGVFNITWQEAAVEAVQSPDRSRYFNRIYNQMTALLLTLCAGILSCNFLMFDYIFDVRYTSSRLYTPVLVTAIIFSMLAQLLGGIQISLKRPKANGITTVTGAAVNLLVHLLLVRFIGLYAAALSTLASNLAVFLMRKRMLKESFPLRISLGNLGLAVVYIYFAAAALLKLPLALCILNLLFAAALFLCVNRQLVKRLR